jgi:hypothetical protein
MHILPHHNSYWIVAMDIGVIFAPFGLLFVLFEIAKHV